MSFSVVAEAEIWHGSRFAVSSGKFWTTVTRDASYGNDGITEFDLANER
jgi:hypothetical protein